MRILIVDDDLKGSRLMQFLLTEQGHQAETVDNAHGALALIERQPPDLILLDVYLPQQPSGFEIYQQLHEQGYDIPVIFVTAKDELEDRVQGLQMGADDYICKPFQPAELQARVDAVLRRYRGKQGADKQRFQVGRLTIDIAELQVTGPDGSKKALTKTEMKLLLQLAQRPGQAFSREELMANVWDDTGESNIVDVYVRRLRRKLEPDPANPTIIQSVRGIGYRLAPN